MAEYMTNDQSLTAVADAIRAKGGTSEQLVYPAGFVSAIDAIQTGTDVSDTTATAADVLSGKYFYTASGTKTQGSIATQAAQTITPGTTDQTISSGRYLTGTQTIKGDANLVAANIAKDTTIFGVTGTHAGGATITDTTDSHGGTIRNIDTENATTIEPLSVTANGTYTAPSGKAYSPVTVDVSGSGGNVTTVAFGDDSTFSASHIGYVDGNGDYQHTTTLAAMSAVSYQMLAGSTLCTIHNIDPVISGAIANPPSTLTLVGTYTMGPSRSRIYIWIYQVA